MTCCRQIVALGPLAAALFAAGFGFTAACLARGAAALDLALLFEAALLLPLALC